MKKTLLFISLLGLSLSSSAQSWVMQTSGITNNLNAVKFIDTQTGWAVGDAGTILSTSNGGSNWTSVSNLFSNSPINFTELDVIGNNIWICTDNALVLYSSDAGSSWSVSTTPMVDPGTSLIAVDFIDQNNGWAVGGNSTAGLVLKTSDGGVNWTAVTNVYNLTNQPRGVAMLNANSILIADGGMIKKTIDSGDNWTYVSVSPSVKNPLALNQNDVWCINGSNNSQFAFKSTNGGDLFNSFSSSLPMNGNTVSIDAVDVNNVQIVSNTGSGYEVFKTNNGGVNWLPTNLGNISGFIQDISFPSLNYAWIVGSSGSIYKYENTADIEESTEQLEWSVFPNPTSTSITIIADDMLNEVTIYDLQGNIVYSENVQKTTISIDIENLSNGIYYVSTGNKTLKIVKK